MTFWVEIWAIIRLFLSKFGREAYSLAKELVLSLATEPYFAEWSDEQRRKYVVEKLTTLLAEKYGHIPGFAWMLNMAIELAVGWVRQQIKERS